MNEGGIMSEEETDKEEFNSEKGEVPEIDLLKTDLITSMITTFESNDLHVNTAINYRYDAEHDYVFLDIECIYNGQNLNIPAFGFDREKITMMSKNILEYFDNKSKQSDK
jgi:hypothetical protein